MFAAFIAFWASIISIWSFAQLAPAPDGATAGAKDRVITLEELAAHDNADDCWKAIDGIVYDFTAYIPLHPTPPVVMTQWCGKEASEAYHTKGYGRPHSPAADAMLPPYRVGRLATPDDTAAAE
jgi:cytochrome b involved in lipid metabolism